MSEHMLLKDTTRTLLDHGYVKYIEHWGSDAMVVETARMSTNKGFLGWEPEFTYGCPTCSYTFVTDGEFEITPHCPTCDVGAGTSFPLVLRSKHNGDQRLLEYLYKHRHMTPFEFAGLTIEVQLPIMVVREWQRHRTQAFNEMSARYVELPELSYIPTIERLMMPHSATNKQAQGSKPITRDFAVDTIDLITKQSHNANLAYRLMLDAGISRELARLVIPVNQYTRMRATAKLRNWLEFMTLRADPAAQWEIQQYAHAVGWQLEALFPRTFNLWRQEKNRA